MVVQHRRAKRFWPSQGYKRQDRQRRRRISQEEEDRLLPPLASSRKAKSESQQQQQEINNDNKDNDIPAHPDEHLVRSLPLLNPSRFPTQHWAGHLPASADGTKYFFYWLFAPAQDDGEPLPDKSNNNKDIPLIIWMNGGPGCSSMDGLWIENGPFRLHRNHTTRYYQVGINQYSWHRTPAYVLYIDQPVGTGLSFTTDLNGYPTNDKEINIDFDYFLQSFFKMHADKFVTDNAVHRPVYFTGESYAGHYIPSMMNYMIKLQNKDSSSRIHVSFAGAAIGNGWVDPYHQYSPAEAAFGHGLLSRGQVAALTLEEAKCQALLLQSSSNNKNNNHNISYQYDECSLILDEILEASFGQDARYNLCAYDIRITEPREGPSPFPYGVHVVESYLGGWELPDDDTGRLPPNITDQVLEAIHATAATNAGQVYLECTDPPYDALTHQEGLGVVDDVLDLLKDENIRLLFFNGVLDLVCDHVGNERWMEALPWKYQHEWNTEAPRYAWVDPVLTTKVVGYKKNHANLGFWKILNAGHMAPMDVPDVCLDMIRSFVLADAANTNNKNKQAANQKGNKNQNTDGQIHLQQLDSVEVLDTAGNCPVCLTCIRHDGMGGIFSSGSSSTSTVPQGMLVLFIVALCIVICSALRFKGELYRAVPTSSYPGGQVGDDDDRKSDDDDDDDEACDDLDFQDMDDTTKDCIPMGETHTLKNDTVVKDVSPTAVPVLSRII